MLHPRPQHNFILFELNFNVKFLSDLKSTILPSFLKLSIKYIIPAHINFIDHFSLSLIAKKFQDYFFLTIYFKNVINLLNKKIDYK